MSGKPLKVLFALDYLGIGGTELNAVRTAEHLDKSRIELSAAHIWETGPLLERYHRAGVQIFTSPSQGSGAHQPGGRG